eukprot:c13416_g1_i1.p1 GENE.c13416_g1_i1~~c13416_g1_i1.p1  ORF type:complete len:539 (-),score=174.25 c13416_g1_i1:56-1588(-)
MAKIDHKSDPEPTMFVAITTYLNYFLMLVFGYIREVFGRIFLPQTRPPSGFAPIVKGFEDFFIRRIYGRVSDCWNRPVTKTPGAHIDVCLRESKNGEYFTTGEVVKCLNLGSYNYLGFADQNKMCREDVQQALRKYGASSCSSYAAAGHMSIHQQLEDEIAAFVGKPAAVLNPMGFSTNSTTIPALVKKGDLIISDALNHASIVSGARSSGAKILVFEHNSPSSLESVLRKAIRQGQPRTGLPWKKILVIVEGIYSMEGEICSLKEISRITKRYKAYLWVDEAHSIGCLGKTGRGVCEYHGVNPDDIDILMGTFTKSFGSVGGYVAGSKELIDYLKSVTASNLHAVTMSPGCAQQSLSSLRILRGEDGTNLGKEKIQKIKDNTHLFRARLAAAGCHIIGDNDSPIIPVMVYHPTKLAAFSRELLKRKIAVVVVGYPATPLLLGRVRFCMSASHSKEELEQALDEIEDVAERVAVLYTNNDLLEKVYSRGIDAFNQLKSFTNSLLPTQKEL